MEYGSVYLVLVLGLHFELGSWEVESSDNSWLLQRKRMVDWEPNPLLTGSRLGFPQNRHRRKKDLIVDRFASVESPINRDRAVGVLRRASSGLAFTG